MNYPRLVIAGTHSGVGKTTATLALLAAFTRRGHRVQAFKAGPDFIDPGHHAVVTGRPSRNLDGWMLGTALSRTIFARAAADVDLSIIEGMMGLFDGSAPIGEVGSTAELAKTLDAPVLLVLDGSGLARSAAAMAAGYARFDPGLRVGGVLLNRVSREGHYALLKTAIEAEAGLPVVGCLAPDPAVTIEDRHLGLLTAIEQGATDLYDRLGAAASRTVDLDRLEALARSASAPDWMRDADPTASQHESPSRAAEDRARTADGSSEHRGPHTSSRPVRIGIARDAAFCFYYPENLELLEAEGAELVGFSTLADRRLPDVDLIYLGGGYPEVHAEALARNVSLRRAIRAFADQGGPIYAECGGLMFLTRAIRDFEGRRHEMVGLFDADAVMDRSTLTLGYREVALVSGCLLGEAGLAVRGHEFHYSALEASGSLRHACALRDTGGQARGPDGLLYRNVLALYTHLHFASQPTVARALVSGARRYREAVRTTARAGP